MKKPLKVERRAKRASGQGFQTKYCEANSEVSLQTR